MCFLKYFLRYIMCFLNCGNPHLTKRSLIGLNRGHFIGLKILVLEKLVFAITGCMHEITERAVLSFLLKQILV